MLKYLVLAAAIVATVAGASYPRAATSSRLSPFGIVEGITDCGSRGRLGTVAVTDCTAVPCEFLPNRFYEVAIRYTSTVTSSTLELLLTVLNGAPFLQVPIVGEIEAGVEYELTFQLPIDPAWSGAEFDILMLMLDHQNSIVEICAQASVLVH